MTPTTIAIADAKSGLSALINDVATTGREYIVTVRNKPSAMIVPMRAEQHGSSHGYGALAGKKPVATRSQEKQAFAEALEMRNGQVA